MKSLKLEEIINAIKENEITAYRISKETNLSEDGINKILSGKIKNPRKVTLQVLSNYLQSNNKINQSQIKTDEGNKSHTNNAIIPNNGEIERKLENLEKRIDLLIRSNELLVLEVQKLQNKIN